MTHNWPVTRMQAEDIRTAQRELNRECREAVRRINQPRLDIRRLIASGAMTAYPRVCLFHRLLYWFKSLED